MTSKRLLLTSVALLMGGFLLVSRGWNGSASINFAYPFSNASVQFGGSANGGAAIAGVFCLALGALSLIGAAVSSLMFDRGKDARQKRSASEHIVG